MRVFGVFILSVGVMCGVARAETPHVAADIAPVHSLVAAVMKGVGEPALLVGSDMSPHSANLRPSAAEALSRANLVVWIGPELEPWLEKSMTSLAPNVRSLALLSEEVTQTLPAREGGVHDHHGDEEHAGEEHEHEEEHADDKHEDEEHGHEDEHEHESGLDPHAWLDPENAVAWVGLIADALSEMDPDHAATYRENAAQAAQELQQLSKEVREILAPIGGMTYVVYHDAFQYFEVRFDLPAQAAVSNTDAHAPGAKHISEMRKKLAEGTTQCAVTDPQFDTRMLTTVAGEDVPMAELDPLGTGFTPGPALYGETLRKMAQSLAECGKS